RTVIEIPEVVESAPLRKRDRNPRYAPGSPARGREFHCDRIVMPAPSPQTTQMPRARGISEVFRRFLFREENPNSRRNERATRMAHKYSPHFLAFIATCGEDSVPVKWARLAYKRRRISLLGRPGISSLRITSRIS